MKVLIILLSVVSLISAETKIRCNGGMGECRIDADCKTAVDERLLFINLNFN